MNEADRARWEEDLGSWLEACDDALAAGRSLEGLYPADLPSELRPRFEEALAYLERLRRDLRPAAVPPPPSPGHTAEWDDTSMLPGSSPTGSASIEQAPPGPCPRLGRFLIRR